MLELNIILIFMAAGIALNLTPGPDMLYCVSRGISQGESAGLVSALGIGGGGLVHTLAAALGLSALIIYSALAFQIVKYAGAAYLVYLGLRILMDRSSNTDITELRNTGLNKIFYQGVVTNVLNPKVALFFLSFLPQFIDPNAGSVTLQILILGTVFNTTGTIINGIVGFMAGSSSGWLNRNPLIGRIQKYVTGSILVGLGARLALSDRN